MRLRDLLRWCSSFEFFVPRGGLILLFVVQSLLIVHTVSAAGFGPEVKRETAVKHKVFEFTQKPSIKRSGDKVEIRFAVKAACDVTVAIERADGKITRHLASGLLGPNAPKPFAPNALKQAIIWDGKNDLGAYVDDLTDLHVRVSLGIKAAYEKDLHTHPYKNIGVGTRIRASEDGVFVFQTSFHKVNHYLRMYDHDGRYVRTVYPFPHDKLTKIKGLKWAEMQPDGKRMPLKAERMQSSLLPIPTGYYNTIPVIGGMVARKGYLGLIGRQYLINLAADGSTGSREIIGPPTGIPVKHGKVFAHRSALSPDGKWIYQARVIGFHAWGPKKGLAVGYSRELGVYRMAVDRSQPPKRILNDGCKNTTFRFPTSISVDTKGRIYVADWENNRVQVFTPDGKFYKSLKVQAPYDVVVHQKTNEIYVFTAQYNTVFEHVNTLKENRAYNSRGKPETLRKFAPIENPKLLLEARVPGFSQAEVDSWTKDPVIWLVTRGNILLYVEKDGRLHPKLDFNKEVAKARCRNFPPRFLRQFLYFDPLRQVLYIGETDVKMVKYFSGLWWINIKTGKQGLRRLPFAAADAAFDANGHLHLMSNDFVARFSPDPWREVPYDYGEERGRIISVVRNTGGEGSDHKHFSLGVSPDGEVIVSGHRRRHKSAGRGGGGKRGWVPQAYPGRPEDGVNAHIFDRHGKIKAADVLPGVGHLVGGLRLDAQKNVYAVIRSPRNLRGGTYPAKSTWFGTLAKFGMDKARFLTDNKKALVPLENKPDRPKDVGGLWADGAEWFYGGVPTGGLFHCYCRQGRFALDYYSRSFVSEPWRYSVAVLDTSGNVLARFGQYGNADSGGPKSRNPLPGDGIGLMDANFLATHTDKRLFISDVGNGRIVSAKLDYKVTETVSLEKE